MNDTSEATVQMRALLEAASPGPWETTEPSHVCPTCAANDARAIKDKGAVFTIAVLLGDSEWAEGTQEANAHLAAFAPSGLALLCDMAEALELLLERIDEGHLVATEGVAARQSEGEARKALAAWAKLVEEVPDA